MPPPEIGDWLIARPQERAPASRGCVCRKVFLPVIPFRRGSGEEYDASVEDIIHHLLTHGYQH